MDDLGIESWPLQASKQGLHLSQIVLSSELLTFQSVRVPPISRIRVAPPVGNKEWSLLTSTESSKVVPFLLVCVATDDVGEGVASADVGVVGGGVATDDVGVVGGGVATNDVGVGGGVGSCGGGVLVLLLVVVWSWCWKLCWCLGWR